MKLLLTLCILLPPNPALKPSHYSLEQLSPGVSIIQEDTGIILAWLRCEEDEPCWECETMGNRICGKVS